MSAADAGQTEAERLDRWVREHARAVRGYVLALVRRGDVADDLVQEVFQRAWQARDRYRDEGHERAYLLRIADRLVVDRSRRLGRELNVDEAVWQEVEPAGRSESPLEMLARRETGEELAAALECLSDAQKRELALARMEEELKRLRDAITQRNEARARIVKERLAELVGDSQKLEF